MPSGCWTQHDRAWRERRNASRIAAVTFDVAIARTILKMPENA
jgi:hypothetical protein